MATPIPQNRVGFALGQIAEACGVPISSAISDRSIQGIAIDSRAVTPGNLFVALRGERHDGHRFVETAVEAGAAAVLVETGGPLPAGAVALEVPDTLRALGDLAAAHRRRFRGQLVAITGSMGKTTTKEFAAAALSATGASVLSTRGNLNNLVGLPMMLFQLDSEFDLAVVELGSSAAGEIARLAQIARPHVGVVTSVALAHTEGLGTLEAVAQEKISLLKQLSPEGVAIYCADSELLCSGLDQVSAARQLGYGRASSADVRLVAHRVGADLSFRSEFAIRTGGLTLEAALSTPGEPAALAAAAALSVVLSSQGPEQLPAALAAIAAVKPVPGRLRPVPGIRQSLLLDDTYNANPESMLASLDTAQQVAKALGSRAIAVLGDMAELGEHCSAAHQRVGVQAARSGLAAVIFCGPEMSIACDAALRERAEKGNASQPHILHVTDPLDAIASVQDAVGQRDVVLVKGSRCMEMERVLRPLTVQEVAIS